MEHDGRGPAHGHAHAASLSGCRDCRRRGARSRAARPVRPDTSGRVPRLVELAGRRRAEARLALPPCHLQRSPGSADHLSRCRWRRCARLCRLDLEIWRSGRSDSARAEAADRSRAPRGGAAARGGDQRNGILPSRARRRRGGAPADERPRRYQSGLFDVDQRGDVEQTEAPLRRTARRRLRLGHQHRVRQRRQYAAVRARRRSGLFRRTTHRGLLVLGSRAVPRVDARGVQRRGRGLGGHRFRGRRRSARQASDPCSRCPCRFRFHGTRHQSPANGSVSRTASLFS